MYAWEAIEQSLTFIEEHLTEEIYTEELANIAGLSPFYFQRLFKRLVNKPVQEYVKLRRLAKVIENLGNTEQRILDAALDYGFTSHANFTRAFKETYGITPEEYRRDLPMLNTFDKPEVSMNYVLVDEGVPLVVGNIVLEIQRKTLTEPEVYLGFETKVRISEQIPAGESTGVDVPGQLWKRYHMEKTLIAEDVDANVEMGMSHTEDTAQGLFTYFAGGLVRNIPHKQEGDFVKRELPAGEYIVCRIEAESFEDLVTVALNQGGKYLFGTWLPHHSLTTEPFSAEKYYRDLKDMACMEIWVKPIPLEKKSRRDIGMDWNMLYTNGDAPSLKQIAEYIDNPLWAEFDSRIRSAYRIEPYMDYSRCSMQPGWNIKYKKSGKSLCTCYPMQGYFIALVVIGSRELTEAELLMPLFSDYVQKVFRDAKTGNGQKWLMLEVRDKEIMNNVFELINLRKRSISP